MADEQPILKIAGDVVDCKIFYLHPVKGNPMKRKLEFHTGQVLPVGCRVKVNVRMGALNLKGHVRLTQDDHGMYCGLAQFRLF